MKKTILLLLIALSFTQAHAQVTGTARGGTGTSTVPATSGLILVSQGNGTYGPQATSTLGIIGKIPNMGGILFADDYTGIDIFDKWNHAYASSTGSSSVIWIPVGIYQNVTTPLDQSINGKRAVAQGAPGGGVRVYYTGTGCAIKVNSGVQQTGITHEMGGGVRGIDIIGNNYSTTSPQIGVCLGGTNGTDGAVLENLNIFHFGQGFLLGQSAYNAVYKDSIVQDNGQNFYFNSAATSGEAISLIHIFSVDGANHNAEDCMVFDNSSTENTIIEGGGVDNCQMHIKQANNVTEINVSHENVGSKSGGWPAYIYVKIDQNPATSYSQIGSVNFNDAGSGFSPSTFIQNGGTALLDGVTARQFGGQTVNQFITNVGQGRVTWKGFNNVSGTAVTNVTGTSLSPLDGTTGSTTLPEISSNTSGGNVSDIKNYSSTGYTSLDFKNNNGFRVGGIGNGNSGTGAPYANNIYLGTNQPTSSIVIMPNNVETARFTDGGNVGFGSTSPISLVSIEGDATSTRSPFNIASSTGLSMFRINHNGAEFHNNDAGASSSILMSQGTSSAPIWVATSTLGFPTGTVTSVGFSVPTGLSISGSPVTGAGTLGLTLTSGYNIPLTASTTQWNNLYNASTSLPYVTSVAMTVPTGLTVSGSPITTNGTLGLTLTSGYIIPTTASTTNYDTFYNVPSTRITAGTGLSWSGNTLNSSGGGSGNSAFTIGNGIIFNATSTDKVGVGSSTPGSTLSIGTNTTTSSSTSVFSVGTSTTQLMTLYGSGNLMLGGQGTSSAQLLLRRNCTGCIGPEIRLDNAADSASGDKWAVEAYDGASASPYRGSMLYTASAVGQLTLDWYGGAGASTLTGQTKLMTLLPSGNFGIGDGNPGATFAVVGNAVIGYSSNQASVTNGLIVKGNVGINATGPLAPFTINTAGDSTHTADISQVSSGVQNVVSLNNLSNTQNNFLQFQPAGGNTPANVNWILGTPANSNNFTFSLWDGSSVKTKFAIVNSGNVGIGVTNPTGSLQVATTTTNSTTTVELGKSGQSKGTCMVMYDQAGTVQYVSIKAGALVVTATACN